jgi:hypothetical protein
LENKAGVSGKTSGAQFCHDFRQLQLCGRQIFKQGVAFGKKEHLSLLIRMGFATALLIEDIL